MDKVPGARSRSPRGPSPDPGPLGDGHPLPASVDCPGAGTGSAERLKQAHGGKLRDPGLWRDTSHAPERQGRKDRGNPIHIPQRAQRSGNQPHAAGLGPYQKTDHAVF